MQRVKKCLGELDPLVVDERSISEVLTEVERGQRPRRGQTRITEHFGEAFILHVWLVKPAPKWRDPG